MPRPAPRCAGGTAARWRRALAPCAYPSAIAANASGVLDPFERPEARAIGLLVQELLHAVLLADLLVVARQRILLRFEIIACLLVGHEAHGADRLLGVAHDVRIELHQLLRELDRLLAQLRLRNREIHKPDLDRALAVECVAGHGVIERVPRAQHVGQAPAHEPTRNAAPVHFRQPEGRVLCRDRKIAGAELRERAAERIALDHRDGRLRKLREELPAPVVAGIVGLVAHLGIVLGAAEVEPQVLTRTPGFALAAKNEHLGLLIGGEPGERILHLEMQIRAHGVALVGPIEPQERDAALPLDQNVLVFFVSHRTLLGGHPNVLSTCRASAMRMISGVPSVIMWLRWSRQSRSTGRSVVSPMPPCTCRHMSAASQAISVQNNFTRYASLRSSSPRSWRAAAR